MGRIEVNILIISTLMTLSSATTQVIESSPNRRLLNVVGGRGLYDDDPKVTVLNSTNFKTTVLGTKNAWLVEFYSSWCGFCQRFAPTWKSVCASTNGWEDVIIAAAIDCANEDNTPLCREYEIMKYPTVKFFPADTKLGDLGTEVDKGKTADDIRHNAIDLLRKEQIDGRGSSWPNIIPYRSSDVQNLWKNAHETVHYTFLIFEESDSYIGSEIILDLHNIKEIQIRCVLNQNEALAKLVGITSFPSMAVLEKDKSASLILKAADGTREDFHKAIKLFLKSKGIDISQNILSQSQDSNLNIPKLNTAADGEKTSNKKSRDTVFQVDLELALQYSLKREIPLKNVISGNFFEALKNYLHILFKYFPTGVAGKSYLEALYNYVLQNSGELRGTDFHDYITKLEQSLTHAPFTTNHIWMGCKGSAPNYRGYPCSLWTLFHVLTVNSVLEKGSDQDFDSLEVLEAMLSYITYFFGCHDCSLHFQEMAKRSMHSDVSKPDDSILWLWKAHNEANKRLAGDITEDPKHPKIQFPAKENCQSCRNMNGDWVNAEVLKYLKTMYSKNNINSSRLVFSSDELVRNYDLSIRKNDFLGQTVESQRFGWNFNVFDMSLCVILYLISAGILCMVFLKFLMRKKYKKKQYVHDLLGKV